MASTLVKICGIKTPEMALVAANARADFIGVVFHKHSTRYVNPETAKIICETIKETKTNVVGVFTTQTSADILAITQHAGINVVQLHGDNARNAVAKLPAHLKRIYVLNVDKNGEIVAGNDEYNIKSLDKSRDYLLFDNIQPGSGSALPMSNVSCHYRLPFFVAGGLSASNVKKFIDSLSPTGVDVSSGVESGNGQKNAESIRNFMRSVKGDV